MSRAGMATRVLGAVGLMSLSLTPPAGALPACAQPAVQALISAESAVSRPVIASPAEYGLSNVYGQIEQATKPLFTYAEAGPQYAGPFEALTPAGSPPPPRAVSAYPSEDIPDESTEDWGGVSHTMVSPISASASSTGGRELGVGDATADGARAWATSIVECDVVTVIAGWHASNVVLAPGVTAKEMGEVLTLVVGPNGSSATTEVILVGVDGATSAPVEGRPTDPFTDPIRENGGPRLEAGEPRTSATANHATASGGGFNFLQTDPSTGQGAGYRIGSTNASIEVIGRLTAAAAPQVEDSAVEAPPVLERPALTTGSSVIGTPPAPSIDAIAASRAAPIEARTSFIKVQRRSWYALFVALATALSLAGGILTAPTWRRLFPTLDWIVRKGDRQRSRFATVYLRW